MRNLFFCLFSLLYILIFAVPNWAEEGTGDVSLPDVVVKAKSKEKIEIEKAEPPLSVETYIIDEAKSPLDAEILEISPVQSVEVYLKDIPPLTTGQAIHPWLPPIVAQPVVVFFPQEREGMIEWELVITDYQGEEVKKFNGKGRPPERIEWDGVDRNHRTLKVGFPYSYVYTAVDVGTNSHTYVGEPFKVNAFKYPREHDLVVDIVNGKLFGKEGLNLSRNGGFLLGKVADIVRSYPNSPISVTVYGQNASLAQKRADVLANYLSQDMVISPEGIKRVGKEPTGTRIEPGGYAQIVIEHAR